MPAPGTPAFPTHAAIDAAADPNELLAQVGSESAAALTSAIERVNTLTLTGRIDRGNLRKLREELERARRVGMLGQQVSRIASPRVRVHDERVDLLALVRDLASQRQREFEAKGCTLASELTAVTVLSDVTLVFAMLGALLDWTVELAQGAVTLRLSIEPEAAAARLACDFLVAPADGAPAGANRSMSWRLVEVCARRLGLTLQASVGLPQQSVEILFPRTLASLPTDAAADAPPDESISSHSTRPLAGTHLLVICARRDLRVEVREAVQSMGLMLDFVGGVEEAREFCAGGLPHAIAFEAAQGRASMQRLMTELRGDAPALGFIEIVESGKPRQASNLGGYEISCVARTALREALPDALIFELTRAG